MAIAAMVALAFLIPLAVLVHQLAHERALARAERQAAIVVSVLAVTTEPDAVAHVVASVRSDDTGDLAVHGVTDTVIGTGHAPAGDIATAADQRQSAIAPVADGVAYLEPVEIGHDRTAVVEVHVPEAALITGVHAAWTALTVVAIGLVVGSAVIGDRLALRIVRPARTLATAAAAFGDGDLDVRVAPSGPRELAEAGQAFNRMADQLAATRIAERELVADLSHRLRTPLTGLRLDIEALETGGEADPTAHSDDHDRRRTTARVRQALGTLEHEIDVLIRTTRSSAAAREPAPEGACDAAQVVRDRMTFWSAVATDQERPCTQTGTDGSAPVTVPAAELGAALDAVLGNALRYTPQGTAIEVAVTRHDGWVAIRIDDGGSGIPDPDTALRRGASGTGSTGLGLDITRRVTEAGGGSVNVGRSRLGGASVVMLLADAEATPALAPSRRGLIGRLTREPHRRRRRPTTRRRGHVSTRRAPQPADTDN